MEGNAATRVSTKIQEETFMIYALPGTPEAKVQYKSQYENFIGGEWVAPVKGEYFDVITPITGKAYTKAARSGAEDVELALDAAAIQTVRQWVFSPAIKGGRPVATIAQAPVSFRIY